MKNERGSILFMVVIFSIILSMVGMATIYMSNMEELFAHSEVKKAQAFYLAEAGLERGRVWLQNSGQYPDIDSAGNFNPSPITLFKVSGGPADGTVDLQSSPGGPSVGKYRVSIDPDDSNLNSFTKKYSISSSGIVCDSVGNEIVTKVVRRNYEVKNKHQYVYYSENETIDPLLSLPDWTFSGKNTAGKIGKIPDYFYENRANIYFSDNDNIYEGTCYANGKQMFFCAQPNETVNPRRVFTSPNYFGYGNENMDPVWYSHPDPQDPKLFNNWAQEMEKLRTIATTNNRGYYYPGDCTILLQGNDKMIINNGAPITIPDYDCSDSNALTVPLVFAEGDITLSKVDIASCLKYITIVSNKKVKIGSSIMADITTRVGSAWTYWTNIGIVANDIIEISDSVPEAGPQIHALMMTNEGLMVQHWDSFNSSLGVDERNAGKVSLFGGLVQRQRKPMGIIYAAPKGTGLFSGLAKYYRYNVNLKNQIPPFFPLGMVVQQAAWSEDPTRRQ